MDIETVPLHEHFDSLSAVEQDYWAEKSAYQRKDSSPESFYDHAGIWAEFGKIICISVGYFTSQLHSRSFRLKSFSGNEATLLKSFKNLLDQYFNSSNHLLCAHNGKEFDFPFIARRMLIRQIELPNLLNLFDKKPWKIPHLDTMHLWRFGDYKHYTSLKLMAHILGVPSPKDDIDGSQIAHVYYKEKDLKRIVNYCEKDCLTVAQVLLRLRNEPLLQRDEIAFL